MPSKETHLTIVVNAQNKAGAGLASVSQSLRGMDKTLGNVADGLKTVGKYGILGFGAVSTAIGFSVKAAQEAQVVQTRLASILRTSTKASDEQIASLLNQADALEKVGVVSADAIVQAQGTFATFDLQAESIHRLIPAFLDLVVAEKGVNATTEDMTGFANALGGALMGNFGALTQRGFRLDEDTKAMIANGTETQRVEALTKVLNSTYSGLNETMRQTSEGGIAGLRMRFSKLQETIGGALIPTIDRLIAILDPILEKVTTWVEKNPKLTLQIAALSAGFLGLLVVLGGLGFLLAGVVAFFATIGGVGALVILALISIALAAYYLYKNWELITSTAASLWSRFRTSISETLDGIRVYFSETGSAIAETWNAFWQTVYNAALTFGYLILGAIFSVLDLLIPNWEDKLSTLLIAWYGFWERTGAATNTGVAAMIVAIRTALQFIQELWQAVWGSIAEFFQSIWDSIVTTITDAIDSVAKQVSRLISLFDKVRSLGGNVSKATTTFGSSVSSSISSFLGGLIERGKQGVNDAIISPDGKIITTHPDDYLIATKNPGSLGGGVTVNINGGYFLSEDAAEHIGDLIMQRLKLSNAL